MSIALHSLKASAREAESEPVLWYSVRWRGAGADDWGGSTMPHVVSRYNQPVKGDRSQGRAGFIYTPPVHLQLPSFQCLTRNYYLVPVQGDVHNLSVPPVKTASSGWSGPPIGSHSIQYNSAIRLYQR
jgi:hypothetical protein